VLRFRSDTGDETVELFRETFGVCRALDIERH
jgi:hypothetical protein